MTDILLVEDNKELSQLMSTFLTREGYSVFCAMSGEEACKMVEEQSVRLVLLDIMLPGMDGYAVCRHIRERGNIPVIILSAMTDKNAKINGFNLGADDYVEKPVDIDILSAKISALFKRYYNVGDNKAMLVSGDISINQDTMEVQLKGETIKLTIKEYDLLLLLIENEGKTLSKDYLFNYVWGSDSFSENQTLTVHIKMLRDKLEEDPKAPKRIVTVWGVGYRYEKN